MAFRDSQVHRTVLRVDLQILSGEDDAKAFALMSTLMEKTFACVRDAVPHWAFVREEERPLFSLTPDDGAIERLVPGKWAGTLSFEGAWDWATPAVCGEIRRAVEAIVKAVGDDLAMKSFSIARVCRIRTVVTQVTEDMEEAA